MLVTMTETMDQFTAELAALWCTPSSDLSTEVDWVALDYDPVGLDPQTREALALLEPPKPRPWRGTAHDYQVAVADAAHAYILFMAGRGCVAPWTRIYLPDEDRHERIDVLARAGRPIRVLSEIGERFEVCETDGAPFLKGSAHLWTVTIEDGREITVTDRHRFRTPQGWTRAADVRVGQLLGVAPHAVRPGASSDPSASLVGEPRSTDTTPGCAGRCSTCRRHDGPQLHQATGSAPGALPSPVDAHGRSRPSCAPDDRESGAGGSRACPPCSPPAKIHSSQDEPYPAGGGSNYVSSSPGRTPPNIQESQPSRGSTFLADVMLATGRRPGSGASDHPSALECPPRPVDRERSERTLSPVEPARRESSPLGTERLDLRSERPARREGAWAHSNVDWQRVRAIEYVGYGPYYDMTVKVSANYVAEGIVNHNSGKTHCAANTLVEWIEAEPGDYAIIAPTFGDAVAICADGPSGFVRAAGDLIDRFNRNEYVIYMKNGSRVRLASADAPDRVRGWNFTGAWCDEVGSWRDTTVWYEGLEFALRIGRARRLVTTTPRRGNKILKDLLKQVENDDPDVTLVRASTQDNAANLSPTFLRTIEQRYAGTTLGRQELGGEMLNDVDGALVHGALIDATRISAADMPELWRVVVGVDPAVSNNEGSDHTGIVVMGIGPAPAGWQPPMGMVVLAGAAHLYLLQDASIKASAETWARHVLEVAEEWAADAIVGEKNNGGDLVELTVRMVADAAGLSMPNYHDVWAAVGKKARAEPVAGVWEQHRVHIMREAPDGTEKVEEEWTGWVPLESSKSPDRVDASCWAATDLMPELSAKGQTRIRLLSAAS